MPTTNAGRTNYTAAIAPASWDADKLTVDVVWSTDAPVLRREGWEGQVKPVYQHLDLSAEVDLSRLVGGPVLDSHASWSTASVVGVVEAASITDGQGLATIRLHDGHPDIVAKVAAGVLTQVSVGALVETWAIAEEEDRVIMRATRWTPVEISLVATGADAGARVQSADVEPVTLPAPVVEDEAPAPAVDPAPAAEQAPPSPVMIDAVAAAEIVAQAAAAGVPEIAAKLIAAGATLEVARQRLADVAEIRRLHAIAAKQSAAVPSLAALIAAEITPAEASKRMLTAMATAADSAKIDGRQSADSGRRHIHNQNTAIDAWNAVGRRTR